MAGHKRHQSTTVPKESRERAATEQVSENDSAGSAVTTISQVDRASSAIEEAIVRGKLVSGHRIHEPKIAQELGVSRGSVREALNRLEGKRLVIRTPNQGTRVVSLSAVDIIELFELREAAEGMACRLATEHMSDTEIDALENLLDRHNREGSVADDGYFQTAGDLDFHFTIARGSGNSRLAAQICGELYHLFRIYRFKSSSKTGRASAAAAEHYRIVEAIRERDPDKAEAQMRLHIRRSRENLQKREFATLLGNRSYQDDETSLE